MATRPVGNPPVWAQTTNYPAGADPWSGNATKVTAPTGTGVGFTPETGIIADYANAELNVLSTWVEWLSFGSNAAGEDAHVVETDSTGVARIAGMVLGGTAGAFTPLVLTANSGATGAVISATNNSGGFAITAASDAALAAVRGTCQGSAPGVEGLATGGTGPGVQGTGNGASTGVAGIGGATGHGVTGTCTGTGNAGVSGTSSSSVAASIGVLGTALRNDCAGVTGQALISGANPLTAFHSGVFGLADTSTGVFGQSVAGYGVIAESTGTTRASLRVVPQASDPIAPLEGDVWFNTAQDKLKVRTGLFSMGLWSTRRGYTYSLEAQVGQISTASQTMSTVATATFDATTEPIIGSVLTFNVIFEMGCSVIALSGAEEFEWQVLDVTDGTATPIAARLEVSHVVSGVNADERYVTAKASYTVTAAGAQAFALQFRSINPIPVVRIRRAVIEITGSHG